MNVGICKLKIHIPGSQSLKDKRSILKSLMARLQKQFNISIAEVDDHDLWQMTTNGVTCVSNHNHKVDEILNSVPTSEATNLVKRLAEQPAASDAEKLRA